LLFNPGGVINVFAQAAVKAGGYMPGLTFQLIISHNCCGSIIILLQIHIILFHRNKPGYSSDASFPWCFSMIFAPWPGDFKAGQFQVGILP